MKKTQESTAKPATVTLDEWKDKLDKEERNLNELVNSAKMTRENFKSANVTIQKDIDSTQKQYETCTALKASCEGMTSLSPSL